MAHHPHIPTLIAAAIGWPAAPLASATDYHAAPSGNDTNDGINPQTTRSTT